MLDVAVATGGLWAASLLADWVAHLGVYRTLPARAGLTADAAVVRPDSGGGVPAVGGAGRCRARWTEHVHRDVDRVWVLVAELGVIALLAVRRTRLPWWQQALAVALLVGVGVLVLGIKIIAH